MENKEKINWWYILIPLFIGGPLFFAPCAAGLAIALFLFFFIIVPATIFRIGWKVFKWAWSR